MRRVILALATVTALVVVPSQAWGQLQVGPYIAFHDDADFGIGAFLAAALPAIDENLQFVGDFGLFFPDNRGRDGVDVDYFEANANGVYSFPIEDLGFTPWVLAGLNIAHGSVGGEFGESGQESSSDTEIGLNLGGGATFGSGPMRPFAGVKFEVEGGRGAVIFGGLAFAVGN